MRRSALVDIKQKICSAIKCFYIVFKLMEFEEEEKPYMKDIIVFTSAGPILVQLIPIPTLIYSPSWYCW